MELDGMTKGKIDELIKDNKVMLFMKGTPDAPRCGFSRKAVALLRVATKERKAFVAKMGGEVYLKTLKGRFAGELTYHDKRVESGGLRSAECAQALEVVNKQFERELERLFEEERQREAKPGDWNTPSLEEKEEDRLEDEQQAREEAERAR